MRCSSFSRLRTLSLGAVLLLLPLTVQARLRVVATLPLYADLVEQIGGDQVEVFSVAKELQDPHFIQPTPWIVTRLARADLFVCTGLDLELWAGPLLEAAANTRVFQGSRGYLDMSQGVTLLQVPLGNVTRASGDVHQMGNPHYFYAPDQVLHLVDTLTTRLKALLPDQAEALATRAEAYRARLAEAEKDWKARLAPFRGTEVVPFHNSFPYFEAWSGLHILDHIEPKPGINPSGSHLAQLTIRMKQAGVKVILHEPFYNRNYSEALARRTGAKVVEFYSQPGKKSRGATYLEMMEANVDALVTALQGN